MSRTRRSFTTEYKVEAHRVINFGRTIVEVARELGLNGAKCNTVYLGVDGWRLTVGAWQ
jgi:transposase-like protein